MKILFSQENRTIRRYERERESIGHINVCFLNFIHKYLYFYNFLDLSYFAYTCYFEHTCNTLKFICLNGIRFKKYIVLKSIPKTKYEYM